MTAQETGGSTRGAGAEGAKERSSPAGGKTPQPADAPPSKDASSGAADARTADTKATDTPETPAEDRRGDFPGVTLENPVTVITTQDGKALHIIHPDDLFAAARSVREQGYAILSCLSAYDSGSTVGVFYAFVRPAGRPEEFGEFRLRCEVAKPEDKEMAKDFVPRIPSIVDVCPAADWQEREAYDMYGIRFEGHPDLRRIFLPEGWKGHPMRKDYDEPEQFVAMQEGEDIVLPTQEEGSW